MDFEKGLLGSFIKVTLFIRNKKIEFLANLYLTFHSWSQFSNLPLFVVLFIRNISIIFIVWNTVSAPNQIDKCIRYS